VYEERCAKCGAVLSRDEIGLHKKLVNRGATTYLCITCLGKYFDLTTDDLRRMIEGFRAQGCSLFAQSRETAPSPRGGAPVPQGEHKG